MSPRIDWADYGAVLFDLDGVITPTAEVHERAWAELFAISTTRPTTTWPTSTAGRATTACGRSSTHAGSNCPTGSPPTRPGSHTICAMGNRKNVVFNEVLAAEGIAPYPGSLAVMDLLDAAGVPQAIVSSSKNAHRVLAAAGLDDRFPVVVDGVMAAAEGLAGKPSPQTFLRAAELLGVAPDRSIVVEDAVTGIAAGKDGGFGFVLGIDRGGNAAALAAHGADAIVTDLGETIGNTVEDGTVVRFRDVPTSLDTVRFPVDPWRLVECEYGPDDLGVTETLFALGNGYIGMRANATEGREAHSHGTYLNGFHETWDIKHAEDAFAFAKTGQTIVNVPDAKLMKLYVDDEPLLVATADLEHYERILDFRAGVSSREVVWRTPAGKRIRVLSQRLVSFHHRHLAMMLLEFTMLDGAAPVVVSSQLMNRQDGEDEYHVRAAALGEGRDPRQARRFGHRVLLPRLQRRHEESSTGGEVLLGYQCANSGMTLACGYQHLLQTSSPHTVETTIGADLAKTVFTIDAAPGETVRIAKLVSYHSSTGVPAEELADRCHRTLVRARSEGPDEILAQQRAWLDEFWYHSDVEVRGDEPAQQAVRWNLFQLAQASARTQEQGIAAKGVTGGGYDGHYFWDTEVYVDPVPRVHEP